MEQDPKRLVIEKWQPEHEQLSFVGKAMPTDDSTRYDMHAIRSEQADKDGMVRIVATDGKRLHIATVAQRDNIFDGRTVTDWKVLSLTRQVAILESKQDTCFPDTYAEVLPTDTAGHKSLQYFSLPHTKANSKRTSQAICELVRTFDCTVNLQYLADIAPSSGGIPTDWVVTQETTGKPLIFENCSKIAAIMPMSD